jgi:hypothetical protein
MSRELSTRTKFEKFDEDAAHPRYSNDPMLVFGVESGPLMELDNVPVPFPIAVGTVLDGLLVDKEFPVSRVAMVDGGLIELPDGAIWVPFMIVIGAGPVGLTVVEPEILVVSR